jgi:hypothetical protein
MTSKRLAAALIARLPAEWANGLRRAKATTLHAPERLLQVYGSRAVLQSTRCVVASGPFTGMHFVERHVFGAPMAKLLGTYEMELHAVIEKLARSQFDRVVNIGAGEGYYAVGLGIRLPSTGIVAYEALKTGRTLIEEVAKKNGVRDRLDLRGICTREALESLIENDKRYLVVSDVEGAELELFHPRLIGLLSRSSLVVESHDFVFPGCTEQLIARFEKTHVVTSVQSRERSSCDFPLLLPLPVRTKLWLMNEGRPTICGPMRWLVMTPQRARSDAL